MSMLAILLNCVTLGMFQPCSEVRCQLHRCIILKSFDDFIFIFFAVEMVLKMVALGVFGNRCFFGDTWNRLDFFIVMAGMMEYSLDMENVSLSAIRTVRVLRPLRAINRVPSMRILVTLLLDTLPMLGNVLLLCFFVFFIFGIVGVQLWAGLLRNRCFLQHNLTRLNNGSVLPQYYQTEADVANPFICSLPHDNGMQRCGGVLADRPMSPRVPICLPRHGRRGPNGSVACSDWGDLYTECHTGHVNPQNNAINFDNIGYAWIAIFQVITLEGWVDIMYYVMDAHSFYNFIYFILLIIVGSFFMINLCLVVIATQFSETKQRENELMEEQRARFLSDNGSLASYSEPGTCYEELLRFASRLARSAAHRLALSCSQRRPLHHRHLAMPPSASVLRRTLLCHHFHQRQHQHHHHHHYHHREQPHSLPPVPHCSQSLVARLTVDSTLQNELEADDKGEMAPSQPARSGLPFCRVAASYPTILPSRTVQSRASNRAAGTRGPATVLPSVQLGGNYGPGKATTCFSMAQDGSRPSQPSVEELCCPLCQRCPPALEAAAQCPVPLKRRPSWIEGRLRRGSDNRYRGEREGDGDGDENGGGGWCKACLQQWRAASKALRAIVESKYFNRGIMLAILVNSLSMGVEFHEQPEELTEILEICNVVFTSMFALEMVLKLLAFGPFGYIRSQYNIFDSIIVIISIWEIVGQSGGGLSVLRTFRLLRVLKLVRFLPALRRQLVVLMRTMDNVATFCMLLMLFIFIFSILGMHLFGCKFSTQTKRGDTLPDRKNFDSLLWAIVTVFQILTQEDWNVVLYHGMASTSPWAALYFIALMTFGNYVLFNLLVAILVEGFQAEGDANQSDSEGDLASMTMDDEVCKLPRGIANDVFLLPFPPQAMTPNGHMENKSMPVLLSTSGLALGSPTRTALIPYIEARRASTASGEDQKSPDSARSSAVRSVSASHCPLSSRGSRRASWVGLSRVSSLKCHHRPSVDRRSLLSFNDNVGGTDSGDPGSPPAVVTPAPGEPLRGCNGKASVYPNITTEDAEEIEDGVWAQLRHRLELYKPTWCDKRYDWSLFFLPPQNRVRRLCRRIIAHKVFDYVVLLFIFLNCITIALERPEIGVQSPERIFLNVSNYIFTSVFVAEMVIKITALGLVLGPSTYLRSTWNLLDGLLVSVSCIDLLVSLANARGGRILGILRVLRLLRTLRPLRVISRAPGLKLVVETLISSLKPIGNIVLICCAFFIIFGILGVQLFKGKFYYCEPHDLKYIANKSECLQHGNKWMRHKYNFDNVGQALMSLFVLASKDGWVNIMYNGLDAVAVDQQPVKNHNPWMLLYFISFLLIVSFFVLNMFVGVVVENFHKCRQQQEEEETKRREERRQKRLEKRRRKAQQKPYYAGYSRSRMLVHQACTNNYLDLFITANICLNVVTMSLEHYEQPMALEEGLKYCNYFFTSVFVLEAILKLIAFGIRRYFKERWNQLDLGIVLLSIMGITLEEIELNASLPINPTIIRIMRVLRIARVLKLLKMATGMRALIDTVVQALPQVGNLGLLFLLLFFIYAALGVELFSRLVCDEEQPCEGLSRHATFQNFGMAFLTLFRVSTGDNWNGIMKDTLRECSTIDRQCFSYLPFISPIYFVTFVLTAQFVLVNVVVAVLMKHLEESNKESREEEEDEIEFYKEMDREDERGDPRKDDITGSPAKDSHGTSSRDEWRFGEERLSFDNVSLLLHEALDRELSLMDNLSGSVCRYYALPALGGLHKDDHKIPLAEMEAISLASEPLSTASCSINRPPDTSPGSVSRSPSNGANRLPDAEADIFEDLCMIGCPTCCAAELHGWWGEDTPTSPTFWSDDLSSPTLRPLTNTAIRCPHEQVDTDVLMQCDCETISANSHSETFFSTEATGVSRDTLEEPDNTARKMEDRQVQKETDSLTKNQEKSSNDEDESWKSSSRTDTQRSGTGGRESRAEETTNQEGNQSLKSTTRPNQKFENWSLCYGMGLPDDRWVSPWVCPGGQSQFANVTGGVLGDVYSQRMRAMEGTEMNAFGSVV
uniref:voltage-dependent T-type calcium channel subunit alpha-1H-like n=1 Tax=Myxine glutinosa TaxID=7769 RepID=UPI00358FD224